MNGGLVSYRRHVGLCVRNEAFYGFIDALRSILAACAQHG